MLNRRVLLVAALLALPCMSVAWGQDGCLNPATAVGANSSFTIELIGGAPSYDGDLVTFTYEVCQVAGQNALSHWVLVPNIDCYGVDEDGSPYTLADLVVGATLQTWDAENEQWVGTAIIKVEIGLDPTTGLNGIKFDDLDPDDACHRYTITFDVSKLDPRYTLCADCIFAATKAGNETVEVRDSRPGFASILGPVCCLIEVEECWEGETAWAAGTRYQTSGNWATYTAYVSGGSVTLYAGQTHVAGTVSFSAPVNGGVTITIELFDGFRFDESKIENVKIQDYAAAPSGNPNPGGFDWKGTAAGQSFEIDVPLNNFYGVHVDVERLVDCPDETEED